MKKVMYCAFFLAVSIVATLEHMSAWAGTTHTYFWANYNHFAGNTDKARALYEQIFASQGSVYTYKGYLNLLFDTKKYTDIIDLIPTLEKSFEHDEDVQLLFVRALENNNNNKASDHRIIQASMQFTTNAEITFRAAQAYLRSNDSINALSAIDTFLNKTPRQTNNFIFYFLKAQIYMFQNNSSQALDSVQKCLEMHPRFEKGWLVFATLHEQEGTYQEAIKGYSTFLEITGKNLHVEKQLRNVIAQQKMKELQLNKQMHNSSLYQKALIYYQEKLYSDALTMIDDALQQTPNNYRAKTLKIKILAAQKQFDRAIELINGWFSQEPDKKIWPRILFLLLSAGVPQSHIIASFHNLEKIQPTALWPQLYLADLYIRENNTEKAIKYLEQCATNTTIKKQLHARIAHQLELLYEKQKTQAAQ